MKTLFYSSLILMLGFGVAAQADDEAKTATKPDAADQFPIKNDGDGNTTVQMDAASRQRAGIQTATLISTNITPVLKTYGVILDPTALTGLLNEQAAAQAAYSASSNELARVQVLAQTGNASARTIQTAEAAATRDRLAWDSARNRLMLSWGKGFLERTSEPAFLNSLSSFAIALARVDLPVGRSLPASTDDARLSNLAGNSADARFIGAALAIDPQTQGQAFIFQIDHPPAGFLPGAALTAYLKTASNSVSGFLIPREAILRDRGATWIYSLGGDLFTRREINLFYPTSAGWLVTNQLVGATNLVIVGAQSLLSEEAKGGAAGPD